MPAARTAKAGEASRTLPRAYTRLETGSPLPGAVAQDGEPTRLTGTAGIAVQTDCGGSREAEVRSVRVPPAVYGGWLVRLPGRRLAVLALLARNRMRRCCPSGSASRSLGEQLGVARAENVVRKHCSCNTHSSWRTGRWACRGGPMRCTRSPSSNTSKASPAQSGSPARGGVSRWLVKRRAPPGYAPAPSADRNGPAPERLTQRAVRTSNRLCRTAPHSRVCPTGDP